MTHRRIGLITDSTCDVPDNLLKQYDVAVVPSIVVWGNDKLRDRVDIQPQEFYKRLTSDPVHPTTAHPSPGDFLRAYEEAEKQGAQEIVVITVSVAMSGTFQSAWDAGKMFHLPVHVVDSKGPTMTVGWQVLAAARAREAGGSAQAMIEAAGRTRATLVQYVCLDTMEYLHRGGRIGGAVTLLSTVLKIKPLVRINHETGLVEGAARVRTRKRALELLYDTFFQQLDTRKALRVAVLHGDVPQDAERIAERIQREYSPAELLMNITGPVLGIHTGPRAVALCGYAEDES